MVAGPAQKDERQEHGRTIWVAVAWVLQVLLGLVSSCDDAAQPTNKGEADGADVANQGTDATTSGLDGGQIAVTPANFPTLFAQSACGLLQRCCSPQVWQTYYQGESCAELAAEEASRDFPDALRVDDGAILFDSAVATQLLADLDMMDCAQLELPQNKELPYKGTLKPGQGCFHDFACQAPEGKQAVCSLGCVVIQSSGGPCKETWHCEDDLYCSPAGTCAAPLPTGAECQEDYDCASTLCSVTAGVCQPPLPLGSTCSVNRECESGFCSILNDVCVSKASTLCGDE